jgi:uncharacterized membrane protein
MAASDDDERAFFVRITTFASNVIGSWWMIIGQTIVIGAWVFLNLSSYSPVARWDSEKLDWLRFLLSLQSLYAAPLILMASRRTAKKDRGVLYEVEAHERRATEVRLQAMERRVRLEEKVDRMLARLGNSTDVNNAIDVDKK